MQRKLISFVVSVLAVGGGLSLQTTPAAAETRPNGSGDREGIADPLGPSSFLSASDPICTLLDLIFPGQEESAAGCLETPSPADCWGQSDYPHHSSHVIPTINGVAWTKCRYNVDALSVEAQLWERRWWGWDRVGTAGSEANSNRSSIKANSAWTCQNNSFRTTGYHQSVERGGVFTASTGSPSITMVC